MIYFAPLIFIISPLSNDVMQNLFSKCEIIKFKNLKNKNSNVNVYSHISHLAVKFKNKNFLLHLHFNIILSDKG